MTTIRVRSVEGAAAPYGRDEKMVEDLTRKRAEEAFKAIHRAVVEKPKGSPSK